jgi:hypothetical protein
MTTYDIDRDDIAALLAVRAELGPAYDDALVESFAERVQRAVRPPANPEPDVAARRRWSLGVVSACVGVPVTAIAGSGSEGSVTKMVVAWGGLVGINAAHALGARRARSGPR